MSASLWTVDYLFKTQNQQVSEFLSQEENIWNAIPNIATFINEYIELLDKRDFNILSEGVYIHKSVEIPSNATIIGPCFIGEGSKLGPGVYIRQNVFAEKNVNMGNSCEFKNVLLMEHVQIPHFSYVGDSILGKYVHFGAGAITSNFRQDQGKIKINFDNKEKVQTDLRKMGAIIGDYTEVGCNVVLNPGTLIGQHAQIYPLCSVRFAIPSNMILKNNESMIEKRL